MKHFDSAATTAALPYGALIDALREMFKSGCEVPQRQAHVITDNNGNPAGTVLVMPAWRAGRYFGLKLVNIFPANAQTALPALHAVYTLFDANTGAPLAQMDGMAITTRRTVAASALAASFLARHDAQRLLIVGTGRVAAELAHAMRTAVPTLRSIEVWGRDLNAAEDLATALRETALDASATPALEAAVRRADIVSCATLSSQPLVRGAWLQPGAHLDLIGAFTPQMRESDAECFARGRVFVDTEEALAKAGDVLCAIAEGAFDRSQLQATLAQLCQGLHPGRRDDDEITVFKSVGTALEDLAAAELVWLSP
jgi:ornithine cyclodeaminase/alanine dehydrogenase-like protein (mu-crystallin family)